MKVSPFAGAPADAASLVNVPKLITAYYAELPDPSVPPGNRGSWDRAALVNTDITELVKRQINTKTKIWQR